MTTLDKKRLIGILTWLIIGAAIIIGGFAYHKQFSHYEQAITEKTTQITRLKREVANKPALIEAITKINQLIDQSKLFIRAPDKQTADAELLSRTKKIIEKAGGKIQSVAPVSYRQSKANNSRVDITLSASQEAFVEIIKNMGASKPLMNITQASLTPIWSGRGRQRIETGNARIQLQVEAFYALGASK